MKVCISYIAALTIFSGSVPATLIETPVYTEGTQTAYDANATATDLIDASSAALAGFTASVPGTWPASGTNDGTATAGNAGGDYAYWSGQTTVDLTYTLTGSPTGYDITSINTIYGWGAANRHAAQNYTVHIATLANPIFTTLYTVDFDPTTTNGQGSSQVTLTDTTGILASGVTAIRFTAIDDADGAFSEVGVIHEYDVMGNPTAIPEPTTFGLFAIGGLILLIRRYRG